jgi:Fe-S cluster biogenesis protein NfuA
VLDRASEAGKMVEVDEQERQKRLADLDHLIEVMRPAVQADGGDLQLVSADPETGVVKVKLQGACGSCAISEVTVQDGVSRILRQRLDWVTEVTGEVEETDEEVVGWGGYVPRLPVS